MYINVPFTCVLQINVSFQNKKMLLTIPKYIHIPISAHKFTAGVYSFKNKQIQKYNK